MSNYTIVRDETALRRFVEWLPKLEDHEKYYGAVFSRKKYCPLAQGRTTDTYSCGRFVTYTEKLINKIKQYEIAEGGFLERNGMPVTQKSLCAYINPNPRNLNRAQRELLKKLADQVADRVTYDPSVLAMSTVHQCPSKKRFIDFDFDDVDPNMILKRIKNDDIINEDCLSLLLTRGGFHLLVRIDQIAFEYTKTFYTRMQQLHGVDVVGDNLIPIPGCTQGNFTPVHFQTIDEWRNYCERV